MAKILLFASCASLVAGVPSVSFPINSQVPPVARVSEAFEFKFSPWTFTSSVQPISYTITTGPSWLMLDSNSQNLYGTPTQDDVGAFEVVITATDSTGSTAHEATFVVSSEPGPVIGRGINSQLKDLGVRNGMGGIIFSPGEPYEFSFSEDTFSPPGLVKKYEAVSTGNTPLPSWINFDQGRLKFSGVTPDLTSLITPPQVFDVILIASDYPGFAGPSVSFQMVVGPHRIYFKDTVLTTNVTLGSTFNYNPSDAILLDSRPIELENLSSLSVAGSDWLSFDEETFVLSGTPPQDVGSTIVDLVAHDIFGGEAQAKLQINILSVDTEIFTTGFPDFNITSGKNFVYSLNKTFIPPKDVKLSAEYNPAVDWITFDAANMQFQGKAPDNSVNIEVIISAQSLGGLLDSRSFRLSVGGDDNTKSFSVIPTRTSTSAKTSQTAKKTGVKTVSPTHTGTPPIQDSTGQTDTGAEAAVNRSRKRTLIIVLATVLPLIVVCSFLFIWYVVSRQKDTRSTSYYSRSTTPIGSDISRPFEQLPQPWVVTSDDPKQPATPRRLSAFGYFTTDGSGRISNGFMGSMMSNDGTILHLGTPSTPPTHSTLLPPAPEVAEVRNSVGPINFSQHPINRTSFLAGPSYSLYPAAVRSNSRGANLHPAVSRPNSRLGDNGHPVHQRVNSRGSNSRPRRLSGRPHRRRSSVFISTTTANRRSGVGHGRPSFGGPPGYGIPKRSWRRTAISPSCWVGGRRFRESEDTFETVSTGVFNQISQVGQVNDLDQPSVRLVDGSPEGAEKASYARARGSSPFFAGSATAWRRGSTMHTPPGVETNEEGQNSLIDDVIKTMTRENSHTKTIGTYSSLNLPETPMRRYNSALPSHFATSSSFVNYPHTSVVTEEDGAFSHVIDETGQRIWYPSHSRESGITAYSRGGSSYYPYEPFEYGVAVTSTRAQGPAMGRPSVEGERPNRVVGTDGEIAIPPLRQRAKLVDFTKKRPVSISEEGGEEETKGSFPADMTYL